MRLPWSEESKIERLEKDIAKREKHINLLEKTRGFYGPSMGFEGTGGLGESQMSGGFKPPRGLKGELYEALINAETEGETPDQVISKFIRRLQRQRYTEDEGRKKIQSWLKELSEEGYIVYG
jgi:hypothetical protein